MCFVGVWFGAVILPLFIPLRAFVSNIYTHKFVMIGKLTEYHLSYLYWYYRKRSPDFRDVFLLHLFWLRDELSTSHFDTYNTQLTKPLNERQYMVINPQQIQLRYSAWFHLFFSRLVPHGFDRQPHVRSESCWLDNCLPMEQQWGYQMCVCITDCSTQTHTHTRCLTSLLTGYFEVFYETLKPGNTSIWSCL